MSIITVLSAVTPNVLVRVRGVDYSPYLFFLGIGSSGCGKSIAMRPIQLLKHIQEHKRAHCKRVIEEYKTQLEMWEFEKHVAIKEHRKLDLSLRPASDEEPQMSDFIIEARTSRSKLIMDLANNPEGAFIGTSELETLTQSLNSDRFTHLDEEFSTGLFCQSFINQFHYSRSYALYSNLYTIL